MNILSLFDGISCGLTALKSAGYTAAAYYAYEIDKDAIKIALKNHPEIIQCGDVLAADFTQYENIDLLLGGSPCQDLSILKNRDRSGIGGKKSSLFWKFKEALETVKPRFFLFENVGNMRDSDKNIITAALGVEPVKINTSLFLPQNRERFYWTNIPIQPLPAGTSLKFKDIMEAEAAEKYYYNKPFTLLDNHKDKNVIAIIELNTHETLKRVYNPNGIIGCLTCVSGGYQEKKIYDAATNRVRKLTPIEYERLQGLKDNYTEGLSNSKRYSVCGNGWTIPVIAHILKGMDNGAD